jgi:hypothetical protein
MSPITPAAIASPSALAVAVLQVRRVGQCHERLDGTAIDGREHVRHRVAGDRAGPRHLGEQRPDDPLHPLRIEGRRRLRHRPQRRPRDAQRLPHLVQRARLLQRPERPRRRVEHRHQDEHHGLVIMQLAVAGLVSLTAVVLQPVDQGQDHVKVLQPLNVPRLHRCPRHRPASCHPDSGLSPAHPGVNAVPKHDVLTSQ